MAATRGRIVSGPSSCVPAGVSIDSRTLSAGQAFFAIVGQVHDGHDHAAAALERGAALLVLSDAELATRLSGRGATVLLVGDTTRALQDLASDVRERSGATVLAITGSAGKTTTKELARLLFAGDRSVHASPGNLNNHYGLPLALLAMPEGTEACVLELGISTPGEMDRLIEIARPDHGLVTIIASAHAGNFASPEELAEEKMKLPRGSRVAHLDVDDAPQWSRRASVTGEIVPRGTGEAARAGLRLARRTGHGLSGSSLCFESAAPGRPLARFELELPLPGEHQARNLLAATSLALAVGVTPATIVRQAAGARPAPHRGEILTASGVTLIDDSYNANPRAMRAALALLLETETQGRRIAVLGDMLELGDAAAEEHRRLGEHVVSLGCADVVVGVGPQSAALVLAARAGGLVAEHVADAAAAGAWLVGSARPGDLVLVKGSRGIGLDRAVALLAAERGAA